MSGRENGLAFRWSRLTADAQNRFGELLDAAQREPLTITRRGRTAL
ncbi:MAG: type II toxin-antitoxin system prevent-host-death family antitoxin [Pseudomonadota bacterium]|nr:type II toxin-antitoxin system prevent-host-death family antitoxin [Pseudomonadota bacterium]